MELNGNITPGASLEGTFEFDSGDYNNLKNKPSINGVTLEGNKTSSDLHIETGGGGGGTTDYDQLDNKPAINGHTLTGDQSAEDIGIITGYPVELPTPTDPSKYLDGSGNWSTPANGEDLSTKEWNLVISQQGGTLSSVADISDYNYLIILIEYQYTVYMPKFINKANWYKAADQINVNIIKYGIEWKVGGDHDEYYIIINKSAETAQIYAGYSGIDIKLYGVI